MPDNPIARYRLFGMQPVLGVPDVRATLDYYRDVLGFEVDFVEGNPPVHARVVADPSYANPTVHIRFVPLSNQILATPTVSLWIHVDRDLDSLANELTARGATIRSAPEDKPWGLRMFTIEDCNGYLLDFAQEIARNAG